MRALTAPETPLSRRGMLVSAARAFARLTAATVLLPRPALASLPSVRGGHPDPRPGITAAKVLPDSEVKQKYKDAYAAARELPEVMDGIFCHCDCAAHKGLRSLLSCFESAMPQSCGICLGEARLARRLHLRGDSLAAIRVAVDKTYG